MHRHGTKRSGGEMYRTFVRPHLYDIVVSLHSFSIVRGVSFCWVYFRSFSGILKWEATTFSLPGQHSIQPGDL